jgi:hypothetical protein
MPDPHDTGPPQLADMLREHEARSQKRYESLMEHVERRTGGSGGNKLHESMVKSDGGNMSELGTEGLGLAALAALSQKGVGNDMSPLALTAMMGPGRHGDGWGSHGLAGAALGFVAGALVGHRGGLFGGEDRGRDCGGGGGGGGGRETATVFDQVVLTGVSDLKAAVPTTALQTQIAINQAIAGASLNELQAIANSKDTTQAVGAVLGSAIASTKDSVQNLALFLSNQLNVVNQNVSEQGCATRNAVQDSTRQILERINANTIAELQAELAEARHGHRSKETEVNVSQVVSQLQNQAQQQQQQQAQFGALNGILCQLHGLTQLAHATNANIVAGNSGPVLTGAQTANPTNIGGVA